jgi:glycosyltransferase involved in cell wall biosynthesis
MDNQILNISFLTSGHEPFDDRIFFHMARSFSDNGHNVQVISSKIVLNKSVDGISLNCFAGDVYSKREKIINFKDRLLDFSPDLIICSEPLTVMAARMYKKGQKRKIKIIYDITEWYPSKKNLNNHMGPMRWYYFAKLLLFNILSSSLADAFIFGEWYKSRPYRVLFPLKPFVFVPYYPDIRYIKWLTPKLRENKLRLCFSGRISLEKGFGNFINVLKEISESEKDINIEVKIIGWYETQKDQEECENLLISLNKNVILSFYKKQPLLEFIELIRDTDIFIDLRSKDFENQHCLPIKLFYYAALGRPVVFTDLKAIKKEVEINKFGFLVHPEDTQQIVKIIIEYLRNPEFYYKHCLEASKLFQTKYNWKKTEPVLLEFINEVSSR